MHPSDFNLNNRSRIPPVDRNSTVDVNRLSTWYEDLEEYEGNLEEMASATLDQSFQDEMQHVNQWFGYLTDPEKTATLYTLLQHSSQVQIRFFIHLLQEMRKSKPNPINRGSERASTLINLNRRPPPPQTQATNRNNRHSFALGDTEQLSRMLGTMGSDWFNNNEEQRQHPLQQPQPRTNIPPRANLRPKSVMELGGTIDQSFSNSWLNQRQPKLFNNENVIERPRSADISNWALPTTNNNNATATTSVSSWKPLGSQHDIDFQQHWKEPPSSIQEQRFNNSSSSIPESSDMGSRRTSMISNHSPSNNNTAGFSAATRNNSNAGFGQYLSPPKNFSTGRSSSAADMNDGLHGYGSDHSDASSNSRYRNISFMGKPTTNTPPASVVANENREDHVDMELLKDVTAWFRSLRLHKYNSVFENMRWQDIIKLDDHALEAKGVAALGARRKMLKVFENVQNYCKANNIEY